MRTPLKNSYKDLSELPSIWDAYIHDDEEYIPQKEIADRIDEDGMASY